MRETRTDGAVSRLGAAGVVLGALMLAFAGVAGADDAATVASEVATEATPTGTEPTPASVEVTPSSAPAAPSTAAATPSTSRPDPAPETTERSQGVPTTAAGGPAPPALDRLMSRALGQDVQVLAPPTTVLVTGTASLKSDHRGATNPGFGTGTCPANTTDFSGTWGWHFVLQGSTTGFVTLTAVFDAPPHDDFNTTTKVDSDPSDNLTITGGPVGGGGIEAFVAHPDDKHAYVFTPGPDYLLVSASATTQGSGTLDTEFNLSHVCAGVTTTTTTAGGTTTTTAGGTTTTTAGGTPTTTAGGTPTTTNGGTTPTSIGATTTTSSGGSTTSTAPDTTGTSVAGVSVSRGGPGGGGAAAGPQTGPSGRGGSTGRLAFTGGWTAPLVAVGLASLLLGLALLQRNGRRDDGA